MINPSSKNTVEESSVVLFGKKSQRMRSQSGRAHIEIVVLMTCLGTLAIVTSPSQSTTVAAPPATVLAANDAPRPVMARAALAGSADMAMMAGSDGRATMAMADRLCGLSHPPVPGVVSPSGC